MSTCWQQLVVHFVCISKSNTFKSNILSTEMPANNFAIIQLIRYSMSLCRWQMTHDTNISASMDYRKQMTAESSQMQDGVINLMDSTINFSGSRLQRQLHTNNNQIKSWCAPSIYVDQHSLEVWLAGKIFFRWCVVMLNVMTPRGVVLTIFMAPIARVLTLNDGQENKWP